MCIVAICQRLFKRIYGYGYGLVHLERYLPVGESLQHRPSEQGRVVRRIINRQKVHCWSYLSASKSSDRFPSEQNNSERRLGHPNTSLGELPSSPMHMQGIAELHTPICQLSVSPPLERSGRDTGKSIR